MLINRRTFQIKPGAMEEAVELCKAERERTRGSFTFSIGTAYFGPFNVLVTDFEFESLEDYQKAWDQWFASPEAAQFLEKWHRVVDAGGSNELWNVE